MKNLVIITVLAISTLAVFAQPSRRGGNVSKARVTQNTNSNNNTNSNSGRRTGSSQINKNSSKNNTQQKSTAANSYSDGRRGGNNGNVTGTGTNKSTGERNRNNDAHRYGTSTNKSSGRNSSDLYDNRRGINNNTVVKNTARVKPAPKKYVTPRTRERVQTAQNHHPGKYHEPRIRIEPSCRKPVIVNVIWDVDMYYEYRLIYPFVEEWHIPYGSGIYTVPVDEAKYYIGDVAKIYGWVKEVYYSNSTDQYYLYMGGYFPYQDFTIIVEGHVARKFSRRPQRYFENRILWAIGYITEFEGIPEMMVKKTHQISLY